MSIRGITRASVESDTTTGLWVVSVEVLVRSEMASDALRQVEDAVRDAQAWSS